MYLDATCTHACPDQATRRIITGCRHEHIDIYWMCDDHAAETLEMGGAALCIICVTTPPSRITVSGITLTFGPHDCCLWAAPFVDPTPHPVRRAVVPGRAPVPVQA